MPRRLAFRVIPSVVLAVLLAGCTASVVTGSGSTSRRVATTSPSSDGGGRPSGPAGSATPPVPAQPAADFNDCSQFFRLDSLKFPAGRQARLRYDCAKIEVPLDYADPTGKRIELFVVRVHDTADTKPTGQLLMNPGGPGGSGVELAVGLSARVSDQLLKHFDLIGFDPRGVGLSSPVSCTTDARKDALNAATYDLTTASGFASAKQAARQFAASCASKYGKSLPEFNTVQTARDMDLIRQAVGDAKMNYLGFSYGTELGSIYAHLFPKRVRVAVLDGAVDPITDDITSFANQLKGFEDSFDQFAAYCTTHDPCRSLGDPRRTVYRIVAAAARSPIPSSKAGETRRATTSLIYTGILSALYSREQWPTLGQALIELGRGDSKTVLTLADQYNQRYDGHYTNISDVNTTINCNDSKPGPTDAKIRATAASWAKRFPIFGSWSAPSLFTCQQWQPDRTLLPRPTAATNRKVLVVGNLHDPATPYQGAKDLARVLGNSRLLSWDGQGHTSYLQGSTCVDKRVDAYLIDATVPPANLTCPR